MLDVAKRHADKSIELEEKWLPGLYNALCIACAEENRVDCIRYLRSLKKYYRGDFLSSSSDLRSGLQTDPDLEFLREDKKMKETMAQLLERSQEPISNESAGKSHSPSPVRNVVIALFLTAFLAFPLGQATAMTLNAMGASGEVVAQESAE
jgi:hypothetical protein